MGPTDRAESELSKRATAANTVAIEILALNLVRCQRMFYEEIQGRFRILVDMYSGIFDTVRAVSLERRA